MKVMHGEKGGVTTIEDHEREEWMWKQCKCREETLTWASRAIMQRKREKKCIGGANGGKWSEAQRMRDEDLRYYAGYSDKLT